MHALSTFLNNPLVHIYQKDEIVKKIARIKSSFNEGVHFIYCRLITMIDCFGLADKLHLSSFQHICKFAELVCFISRYGNKRTAKKLKKVHWTRKRTRKHGKRRRRKKPKTRISNVDNLWQRIHNWSPPPKILKPT